MIKEGDYITKRLVRFTYGNTHEEVAYPQAKDGSGKSNRWIMQLSINVGDGKEHVSKYIQEVMYILHPTYAKSVIKITEPPFRITRLAWGYFDVTMKITFKRKFKIGTVDLVHNLKFNNGGLK